MGQIYSATSGKTAGAAAASIKVAIQLATGANEGARIVQIDVTFNGTSATAKPVLVELVKTTGASSGGSTYTPLKVNADAYGVGASIVAVRINDTSDGSSPTIQQAWLVPATSGIVVQFPLGREIFMAASEFWEVRVTWQTSETVTDYIVNTFWEE